MNRKRIVISESAGFPAVALNRLRQAGDVVVGDLDRRQLEEAAPDADVLWVRLRHRIDAGLLKIAKRLEVIATPTTGLTHIDTPEVERRGIELVSLRGETEFLKDVRATAEHTIGLMLALIRHLPAAAAHACAGGWNRDLFQGAELFGKTVAVVGFGRLGRIVTRYLTAFDCRVLAVDPHVRQEDCPVPLLSLEEAIGQAHIVTLHVNLTDDTRGFFDARCFGKMRPGSYFINTSRGELVDEEALIAALASGALAGAAVDVLSAEDASGMASHPLVQYAKDHPRVLVTPHIGGCTVESMEKAELFLCNKLLALLASGLHPNHTICAAS